MYLNGIIVPYNIISVADLGDFGGFDRIRLWAAPSTKSIDDRLMEPPRLSGYETKKTAAMAHLSIL